MCWRPCLSTARLLLLFACSLSSPLQAAERCVDPANAACFDELQAAVDAAEPGDTILVAPHPDPLGYSAGVTVDVPGLVLRGTGETTPSANAVESQCPEVILDGCPRSDGRDQCNYNAPTLVIAAPGVTIERFTFRHAEIRSGGEAADFSGLTVQDNCSLSPEDGFVALAGDGSQDELRVRRNVIRGGEGGVFGEKLGAMAITGNQLLATHDSSGLLGNVDGHLGLAAVRDGVIAGNSIYGIGRTEVVQVQLEPDGNARIEDNLIVGGGFNGIELLGQGGAFQVLGNRVMGVDDRGIYVYCTEDAGGEGCDLEIARNRVQGPSSDDRGIDVSGVCAADIHHNEVALVGGAAIGLRATTGNCGPIRIRENHVMANGSYYSDAGCIVVGGASKAVAIEENRVDSCTVGIRLRGGEEVAHEIRGNRISGSLRDGIKLEYGEAATVIRDNVITGAGGAGLSVSGGATAAEITGNKVTGSRQAACIDTLVDGPGPSLAGNEGVDPSAVGECDSY